MPERASLSASLKAGASSVLLLLRGGVAVLDVVVENLEELGDDPVALQRELERAVHEYGRLGLLERARQRDADVRVLALAGTVEDRKSVARSAAMRRATRGNTWWICGM